MATTWYTKPISQLLMLLSLTLCASANMKCDMNLLRQCNENDNSYCCKRLRDSYFMMETGFLTGKALLTSLLNSYESSTKDKICSDTSIKIIKSLSELILHYQALSTDNETGVNNMDLTTAFSYLLEDIEQNTCGWVAVCFPSLSCQSFLTLSSLESSLRERVVDTSIIIGRDWRWKWAEEALCDQEGNLKFTSATSFTCG